MRWSSTSRRLAVEGAQCVDAAKEISRKVRESDVPPGFLPRVQM